VITLFNQYKNIILFSVIGILVLLLSIQSYRINSYQADLAKSSAQVTILSASIESQNESLNNISKDGIKRAQDSLEAINALKRDNDIKRIKITSLNSQLGKIKSCDSAVEYVKGIL
jgi:multidrug resistance efflux pump